MTAIAVRQSGGANIVSIPKAIIKTLGLKVGSKLDLSIKNNRIILTPIEEEVSLEVLLAGSPKNCFKVTEEDRGWIDAKPSGKEI
ncbi:MAG: AbrB/MazE/SpoVT family DNA-binding domain-containing protein [Gammaproteobacteria bacterium]|nr:MAG: AbrB/MazE/SpoVT family DNA-binding domain-containing protein [Gammaproteobacteria bacterium]